MFIIDSLHGKDVSAWSRIPSESEVLFDQGTTFRVTANYFDADLNKQIIVMGDM
jgi:hypothetical protein